MGQPSARQSAISAVTAWQSNGHAVMKDKETPIRQLFGANVFSDEVMRSRLPENIYRAMRNTIKKGAPLEETIADIVAAAMALDPGRWNEYRDGRGAERAAQSIDEVHGS